MEDVNIEGTEIFADGGYIAVIAIGVAIILGTIIASELLVRIFKKGYHITRDGDKAGSIFTIIIRVVVWVLGAYLFFKLCLGMDISVLLGALGIGGLALSLGLQDTISNLLGGLFVSFGHSISIGDWIKVGSVEGTVKDINWRITELEDDIGQIHVIPNSALNSTTVTRMPEYFRVPITLTLARDIDLGQEASKICAIADKALDEKNMRCNNMPSVLVENGVGADGVTTILVVYATWDYSGAQVKLAVVSPVVKYLQANNLIGRWE